MFKFLKVVLAVLIAILACFGSVSEVQSEPEVTPVVIEAQPYCSPEPYRGDYEVEYTYECTCNDGVSWCGWQAWKAECVGQQECFLGLAACSGEVTCNGGAIEGSTINYTPVPQEERTLPKTESPFETQEEMYEFLEGIRDPSDN